MRRLKLVSDGKSETPNGVSANRDELIGELKSPNPTRRALAREELALLPNANANGLLTQAATGGWHFRMEDSRTGLLTTSLWLLQRAGALDDQTLLKALQDRDEAARVHALRILTERGLRIAAQSKGPALPASPPLPAGEGRGEGERLLGAGQRRLSRLCLEANSTSPPARWLPPAMARLPAAGRHSGPCHSATSGGAGQAVRRGARSGRRTFPPCQP